jgi:hypothetical protein
VFNSDGSTFSQQIFDAEAHHGLGKHFTAISTSEFEEVLKVSYPPRNAAGKEILTCMIRFPVLMGCHSLLQHISHINENLHRSPIPARFCRSSHSLRLLGCNHSHHRLWP